MKRSYIFNPKWFVLLCLLLSGNAMSGQTLFEDNFDYPTGNLYGNGQWWQYSSSGYNAVKVIAESLTYDGYQSEAVGGAIRLSNSPSAQKVFAKLTEGTEQISDGTLYFSTLIKIEDMSYIYGPSYLISLLTPSSYDDELKDKSLGTEVGMLFVGKGSDESKFRLGVGCRDDNQVFAENEYNVGETYQVIVKYQFNPGANDDVVSLFVNSGSEAEPATADAVYTAADGDEPVKGFQGLEIRQASEAMGYAPTYVVDAVRVARSYGDLFGAPAEPAVITTDPSVINLNNVFEGQSYKAVLNVKGTDLRGDITVGGEATEQVKFSTTTIAKADAESADGFNLEVEVSPKVGDKGMYEITLDSPGADQVKVTVSWTTTVGGLTLFEDNFDYPAGNLYGNGQWWQYSSSSYKAVQVTAESLTYDGYQSEAVGGAAKFSNTPSAQDVFVKFMEGTEQISDGSVYVSFLLRVDDLSYVREPQYLMSLLTPGSSSEELTDKSMGTEVGMLFVNKGSDDTKFCLGVGRQTDNQTFAEDEYNVGETYQVIVKYQFNPGTNDDAVSLFVNSGTEAEPATADALYAAADGDDAVKGFQGVEFRQASSSMSYAPTYVVDAVRVARSYENLFGGEAPIEPAVITTDPSLIGYNNVFLGQIYKSIVNVKGTDLRGDITIGGEATDELTFSTTTIAKAEAESAEGFNLEVELTPKSIDSGMYAFTLDSEGAEQVKVLVFWYPVETVDVADLKSLTGLDAGTYETYRYTGKAIVTYCTSDISGSVYYLQDATGGLKIVDAYGDMGDLKEGDEVSGFAGYLQSSFGSCYFEPMEGTASSITVSASGMTVEPVDVTLADIKATPKEYASRLVRVANVTFKDVAGQTFTEEMTNPEITDGTDSGRMNIFDGTDIVGTTVPSSAVTITGISTSGSAVVVGPRRLADMEPTITGDPSLVVEEEMIFDGTAAQVGQATEYMRLRVAAANLPSAVSVYITGKDGKLFSLSAETIEAGTSNTDIVVTYTPDNVGKHEARINFESSDMPELNTAFTVRTVAIDPENPPTIVVDAAALTEFKANVGEKQTQTIKVVTKGLPDFANVKLMGEGEGSFLISTTMLLKEAETDFTITFQPKKEGKFTERIEFSALEAETVYITVVGDATGSGTTPDQEGDTEPLSDENPLSLLIENFSGNTNNQPLALEGWRNYAVEGTRAWWGYNLDGEGVAKVSGYNSMAEVGESTPSEMLLVTPPLDFVNAATKMFTFRVMGDLMREEQDDELTMVYITLDENGNRVESPFDFQFPNIPDQNGEWLEYHFNLSNQDLDDVFFIGFRFKTQLGRENTTVYYIDDVSFGRTDLPMITPSVDMLEMEATVGQAKVSEEITVETLNTTEPVVLTVGGPNKSKFEVSPAELPAGGGKFTIKFQSNEVGVHEAYVKISSRGAADVYVPVAVNNVEGSGIAAISFEELPDVTVYDLYGRILKQVEKCASMEQLTEELLPGTYVVKAVTETTENVTKIIVR